MPQMTVYIRNEDLDKWKALPNKAMAISNMLNSTHVGRPPKVEINPLTIPGVMKGSEFIPKPPDPETGYPCCLKQVPCKHWVYNGTEGYWKNILTGKTREVNG